MRAVRESLIHAGRVEVPDRRPAHDIQPEGSEDAEVDGGVELFHEPALLPSTSDPESDCQGSYHALHQELSREGEHDGVEGHEGEVLRPFTVLRDIAYVRR